MAKKKPKLAPAAASDDESKGLWISPRFSLKSERTDREGANPGSARFLELADIALGTRKPEVRKKRAIGTSAHITSKTEPYSR